LEHLALPRWRARVHIAPERDIKAIGLPFVAKMAVPLIRSHAIINRVDDHANPQDACRIPK
jgi:hypothetical protein